VLGVLPSHPRRDDVRACLVELDPVLAARARRRADDAGLAGVEVRTADAALVDGFADAAPANVVLVCGIFGNISDDDIERTVVALPQLCERDATVLWTRHRRPPDLTPTIRDWFSREGFDELAFEAPEVARWVSVGAACLRADPQPLEPGTRLFTFTR
jgi:hypothetical protein